MLEVPRGAGGFTLYIDPAGPFCADELAEMSIGG
jgi:hypothetical protein